MAAKKKVSRKGAGISPKGPLRERTTMRLSAEVMGALKRIARSENRSVSNLVETTLREYAETRLAVQLAPAPAEADESIFA